MKYLLSTLLALSSLISFGQTKAVTDNGKEVLLYDNGTWEYVNNTKGYETRLDTPVRSRIREATFLLKGQKVKYGVYLDPKKWKFKEVSNEDESSEYGLSLKGEDAYAMIIPERIEIPLSTLQEIALSNAKEAAPDAHIVKEEIRKVNGHTIKMMEMAGTIRGISFVYLGYYYVGEKGTIQFIAYTAQNLLDNYRKEMEELLNGFVLLE